MRANVTSSAASLRRKVRGLTRSLRATSSSRGVPCGSSAAMAFSTSASMARDGFLWPAFHAVHKRFHTPHRGTIIIGVIEGIRNTDHRYVEVARVLETSRWRLIRRVVLPGALPTIIFFHQIWWM